MNDKLTIVFMGVSGSGKTTMALRTARYLCCEPVIEADAYHSPQMKAKMAAGVPLNDDDRWPWLESLNRAIRESTSANTVVTCSALKKIYRERLLSDVRGDVRFLFLDAPKDIIHNRMVARSHEFMPVSLLDSQFDTLERPEGESFVTTISVAGSEDETFARIQEALRR